MRRHLLRKFESYARRAFAAGQCSLVFVQVDAQLASIWFA